MRSILLISLLLFSFQSTAQTIPTAQAKDIETFIKNWFAPFKMKKESDLDSHMTEEKEEQFLVDLNKKMKSLGLKEFDIDSFDFDLNLTPAKKSHGVGVNVEIIDGQNRYCLPCYGKNMVSEWSVAQNVKKPEDLEGRFGMHLRCVMGLQSLQKSPANPINRFDFKGSRFFPFAQTQKPTGFYVVTSKNIFFYPSSLPGGLSGSAFTGTIENDETIRIFAKKLSDGSYSYKEYTRSGLAEEKVGAGRQSTDVQQMGLLEKEVEKQLDQSTRESGGFTKEHEKVRRCSTLRICDRISWSSPSLKEKVGKETHKYFCNTSVDREDNGRRIKTTPASYNP